MRPIGILGGTFDPVHFGHLRLAIECYEKLDLQEVRLIPLHTPPHRNLTVATPGQRLDMLRIAVEGIAGLKVDDCELQRGNVSYTIDTVSTIRKNSGTVPLCLLMGADALNTLHTWRRWQELLDYVHFVIAGRTGNSKPENGETETILRKHAAKTISELSRQPCGKTFGLTIPLLDISATQIRATLLEGRNPAGLLPEPVIHYIHKNKIYTAH
jgi:nicotinate-nucleotide adenylyltransferase